MVFPYPQPDEAEQRQGPRPVSDRRARSPQSTIDPRKIEEERWVGDDVIRELGERGLLGPLRAGGVRRPGPLADRLRRVFEAFAQIDATLSVVIGVHQSIGMKGIVLFGSDEQKERFLPDLATGRKLAGFALTEPNAGSDAYNIESRAVEQPDGSWVLNGEKRYIGNGSKGRRLRHVRPRRGRRQGPPHRPDPREGHEGLRGRRALRHDGPARRTTCGACYFNDVRVPPENVLGEPGEGFRIAMHDPQQRAARPRHRLGRRRQVPARPGDRPRQGAPSSSAAPLADFELVQEKIGWMVSYLFGLESMAYLTTGLVDAGVPDYSLESAICKVAGTEFLWYAANRALQLAGGAGLHARRALREDPARHPHLPDLRGRQRRDARLHRAVRASSRSARSSASLGDIEPQRSDRLARRARRLRRRPHPARGPARRDHDGPRRARALADAGHRPGQAAARCLESAAARAPQGRSCERQFQQKRLADAVADIYAQIAVLSRVTRDLRGAGRRAARARSATSPRRSARRAAAPRGVAASSRSSDNDDERMTAIAKLAYKRGEYGYAFFED